MMFSAVVTVVSYFATGSFSILHWTWWLDSTTRIWRRWRKKVGQCASSVVVSWGL